VKQRKNLQKVNENSCGGGNGVNSSIAVGDVRWPKFNWEIPVQAFFLGEHLMQRTKFQILASVIAVMAVVNAAQAVTVISAVSSTNGEPEGVHRTGDTFNHVNGNVSPNPHTVPTFGEDVFAFTDRDHQYNGNTVAGLPAYLVGGDYVMTENDARDNDTFTLDVTLAHAARLYVIRDARDAANLPSWFTDGLGLDLLDTGDVVGYDEGGGGGGTVGPGVGINQTGRVYIATDTTTGSSILTPGTFKLFESSTNGQNMYGVVAVAVFVPEPATATLGLLAFGGMMLRRRRMA